MSGKAEYRASCTCGNVAIEAKGEPILTASCYCASCQTAGRDFEQAPGAPSVLRSDRGTDYCLFRKDRVKVERGGECLEEYRLADESPTRRIVATCCNAPMFLDFTAGHWLTLYRDRLPAIAPQVEMCVMTRDRPPEHVLPQGVRAYATYPPIFMVRMLFAWARMGFRKPYVTW